MSDIEDDYSSEGDDDYMPSGEASEGDSDEGDLLLAGGESGDEEVTGNVQAKSGKKRKKILKKKATETARKRKGGIQLEGEEDKKDSDDDNEEGALLSGVVDKEEQERKKEEAEKKRADDLWSSFMKDVGPPKKAKVTAPISSAGKSSTGAASSKPSGSTVKAPQAGKKETVTITKVFDFAGEKVKVTEKVSADSKEAKSFLKKEEAPDKPSSSSQSSLLSSLKSSAAGPSLGVKRPGGLSSVLGQLGKKSKISTLEKSKLDWNQFKAKEGIEDELTAFVKGKSGYVEKQNFLARADQRQYEQERELRLSKTKILR
ncbi:craniofacial development protein 1-like [Amphiura filiformis]|uniref:craniofacial development protein 1-like n=1 Tax=Amphiura filiformis TaxID=82378 RepID=UPI003B21DB05